MNNIKKNEGNSTVHTGWPFIHDRFFIVIAYNFFLFFIVIFIVFFFCLMKLSANFIWCNNWVGFFHNYKLRHLLNAYKETWLETMWFTIFRNYSTKTIRSSWFVSAFYLPNTDNSIWFYALWCCYQIVGLIYYNLSIIWSLNRMSYKNYSTEWWWEFQLKSTPLDHRPFERNVHSAMKIHTTFAFYIWTRKKNHNLCDIYFVHFWCT